MLKQTNIKNILRSPKKERTCLHRDYVNQVCEMQETKRPLLGSPHKPCDKGNLWFKRDSFLSKWGPGKVKDGIAKAENQKGQSLTYNQNVWLQDEFPSQDLTHGEQNRSSKGLEVLCRYPGDSSLFLLLPAKMITATAPGCCVINVRSISSKFPLDVWF